MAGNFSCVIIGATGGIGSALTRRLAKRECSLFLAAQSQEKLDALGSETDSETFALDAAKSEEVEACLEMAQKSLGRIDAIVNCVGSVLLKPAHTTSDEEWHQTIALNLHTSFYILRSATKRMRKEGGSIVLLSSCAARAGVSNHEAIAAAKAGVIGLTLSAAATYSRYGIRVNAVAPGLVQTPLTEAITSHETSRKASLDMHPLGRLGEPEDIASAIEWFLDPQNSWATGQVLGVDGGLACIKSR